MDGGNDAVLVFMVAAAAAAAAVLGGVGVVVAGQIVFSVTFSLGGGSFWVSTTVVVVVVVGRIIIVCLGGGGVGPMTTTFVCGPSFLLPIMVVALEVLVVGRIAQEEDDVCWRGRVFPVLRAFFDEIVGRCSAIVVAALGRISGGACCCCCWCCCFLTIFFWECWSMLGRWTTPTMTAGTISLGVVVVVGLGDSFAAIALGVGRIGTRGGGGCFLTILFFFEGWCCWSVFECSAAIIRSLGVVMVVVVVLVGSSVAAATAWFPPPPP